MSSRGFLHVIAHGARGLRAADISILKKPTSDPYCILSLDGVRQNTRTIREDLNPKWEEAFSFQVGAYLSRPVLALLGEFEAATASARPKPRQLSIRVLDQDQWSTDDPLGSCEIDLTAVYKRPRQWFLREVRLQPPAGRKDGKGEVMVSLFWQPSVLTTYTLHILGTACYAIAFALAAIGSFCRWEPKSSQALQEPGVAAAMGLAAVVSLLATVSQFVLAHMTSALQLDKLAAVHGATMGLNSALDCGGNTQASEAKRPATSMLNIRLKTVKLTSYDLEVMPNMALVEQMHLPVVLVSRLLPFGSMALLALALALQASGSALLPMPGELSALAALGSTAAGVTAVFFT